MRGRTVRVVAVGSKDEEERAWRVVRRILLNAVLESPELCSATRTGADLEAGLIGPPDPVRAVKRIATPVGSRARA